MVVDFFLRVLDENLALSHVLIFCLLGICLLFCGLGCTLCLSSCLSLVRVDVEFYSRFSCISWGTLTLGLIGSDDDQIKEWYPFTHSRIVGNTANQLQIVMTCLILVQDIDL